MLQGGEAEEGWVSCAADGAGADESQWMRAFLPEWAGITAVLNSRATAAASHWDAQGSWDLCR